VRRALLDNSEGLPAYLERVLVVLETLREQIAQAGTETRLDPFASVCRTLAGDPSADVIAQPRSNASGATR
jgi:hypothetical protein